MNRFAVARQRYALDAAAMIKGEIYSEECRIPFKYSFYMGEDVLKITIKPQTYTLLHDYISYRILDDFRHDLKKMGCEIYQDIYKEFDAYNVIFQRFEEYQKCNYHEYLFEIFNSEVNPSLVKDTFTLLFRDRDVMRQFNLNVSEEIKKLKQSDYPSYLKRDGVMVRWTRWPVWLKKGLLKREDGHCAICQRDLTGVYANTANIAIDHIVPLNLEGTNDPTNLQMVCDVCNGDKGGDKLTTSDRYASFW
ncbi:HNH endonuclease [Leclercia pneumoniae]|uniref:HNH endonuclease n=1 Tax=Leclercia pneumoniae TaxID=2815358 RepID=A0ABX8JYV5_9ENTR|nr:HNH endonuclease [Leclercia pneumoniae]QSW34204.1 HNH endonuclease [Leclercia pneumoniae]QWW80871.1 HNH endonuclease [Leclercia pneumoniae]